MNEFPYRIRRIMETRQRICAYCKQPESKTGKLELDHLIPVAEGGLGTLNNARLVCGPCHARKSEQERLRGLQRHHKAKRDRIDRELAERGVVRL